MNQSEAAKIQPQLPDLAAYRRGFIAEKTKLPLRETPWKDVGLLSSLPEPPRNKHGWPWDVETKLFATTSEIWPKITIVTPSFNQADFLEETIRSVLLQNYPHLEYIVLDGGSTDGSAELIDRYRPWLSFSRIGKDRGQAHAINLGFSLADGTSLRGWLNSDDFYLPGSLLKVAESARKNRAHDFFYGDALTLDEQSGRLSTTAAGVAHERYVRFPGAIFSHAAFWTARAHVPLWEEQHCALDYELWIRLLRGRHTRHIAAPLGVFRAHAAAKSFSPTLQRQWAEDAARNGQAHPHLYRTNRLLAWEHRFVQRIIGRRRTRRLAATLPAVLLECGWSTTMH